MNLAIIVPYRNRKSFLDIFLSYVPKYLENTNKISNYDIIISEQLDNTGFNRGLSVNAGVAYCINKLNADYIVAHNVDMIPVKNVDYSYQNCFVGWFLDAGGFNCSVSDFVRINGYCNSYYGWGTEDTDLLDRCGLYGINLKKWENEFAPISKPVICNLEFKNNWDSEQMSKKYWGTKWPRFITPKEYGIEEIHIDKTHQWHDQSLMKKNESKRDGYRLMDQESKDRHYQNSGLNRINCNFNSSILKNNNIHHITYRINNILVK